MWVGIAENAKVVYEHKKFVVFVVFSSLLTGFIEKVVYLPDLMITRRPEIIQKNIVTTIFPK